MANHDVSLKVGHPINLGNADSELEVKRDGKLLGRLKISTGGVDWIPAYSQTRFVLNWVDFGAALKQHGEEKPK